jgi:hypothetical protein
VFYDSGMLGGIPFIVGFLLLWAGTRRAGSTWFFIAFAIASTTTNVVWFAFPWVIGALFVRLSSRNEEEAEAEPEEARLPAARYAAARRDPALESGDLVPHSRPRVVVADGALAPGAAEPARVELGRVTVPALEDDAPDAPRLRAG